MLKTDVYGHHVLKKSYTQIKAAFHLQTPKSLQMQNLSQTYQYPKHFANSKLSLPLPKKLITPFSLKLTLGARACFFSKL